MESHTEQACEDLLTLVWRVKFTMFGVAELYGVTPVQLFALYAVSQGATSMGRVAETMHCDASNVTGVVDRLVAQKLVVRSEDAVDRRAKHLEMTEKGRQVIQGIIKALPERLGCNQLSVQECSLLHNLASKTSTAV